MALILFFFSPWPVRKRHSSLICFLYFSLNTAEVFHASSSSYLLSHFISADSPVKHIFIKARERTVAIKSSHAFAWSLLLAIQKRPPAHSRRCLAAAALTFFFSNHCAHKPGRVRTEECIFFHHHWQCFLQISKFYKQGDSHKRFILTTQRLAHVLSEGVRESRKNKERSCK